MKKLFKSVIIITIFTALTKLIGFLFRIYLSRSIGAEAVGIYQSALSIFTVLLTIVSTGLPLVVSKITARYEIKKEKHLQNRMVTSAFLFAIIMSAALCLIVAVLTKPLSFIFTDERCVNVILVLLPAVVFSAVYSVFRGYLWGKSKYFGVCVSELFEQVARIIIFVILIGVGSKAINGAMSAGLSLSVACFVSALLVIVFYLCDGGRFKKPDKSYREIIKTSAPIAGVRVVTSAIQPIIAILLPIMLIRAGYSSSQAMSLYGVAVGMTLPMLFIPVAFVGSLSMALVPELSAHATQNNSKEISSTTSSSISFAIFVSFFLIPIFIAVGDKIGIFFYDNYESGYLLSTFAWIMLPLGLSNITTAILNSLGSERQPFINNLIGSVALLLVIWIMPRFIGINAFGIGMGICMSLVSILNLRVIRKKTSIKLPVMKPILKMSLCSIPTIAITSFSANILAHFLSQFFVLAYACSIGAIFFFTLCVIFKVIDVSSYYVKIKKIKIKLPKIKKKRKKRA